MGIYTEHLPSQQGGATFGAGSTNVFSMLPSYQIAYSDLNLLRGVAGNTGDVVSFSNGYAGGTSAQLATYFGYEYGTYSKMVSVAYPTALNTPVTLMDINGSAGVLTHLILGRCGAGVETVTITVDGKHEYVVDLVTSGINYMRIMGAFEMAQNIGTSTTLNGSSGGQDNGIFLSSGRREAVIINPTEAATKRGIGIPYETSIKVTVKATAGFSGGSNFPLVAMYWDAVGTSTYTDLTE